MRQRRHVAYRQFANLASADPLRFSDRGIAILRMRRASTKNALPAAVSVTPLRCLSNNILAEAGIGPHLQKRSEHCF